MRTLLIKNGILVNSEGLRPLDVLVTGETITSLHPHGEICDADEVVDATGLYVLPGLIDAHTHPVYADTMNTLSKAAVLGGITTMIPYIGSVAAWGQAGGLVESIDAFIKTTENDVSLDFSLHATFTRNVMDEISSAVPALCERGIFSFKAFTSYLKRGMKLEDEELLRLMDEVARHHGLLAFHAENESMLNYMEQKLFAQGLTHPRHYPSSHPALSEAEAVFRVLSLAAVSGCAVYLPHLTCAQSLQVVELFRSWNALPTLYTETCPHYLTLDESELEKRGNLAKMSPPLRTVADQDALWRALREGRVDVVASDAAGHATSANEPLFADTFKAPHGTPGTETLFPVLWQKGVNTGRLTVPDIARLLSENPARIFGLYPRKGCIAPGSDADMTLIDPHQKHTLPAQNPHLHVDYSLFAGLECLGGVQSVILRGRLACHNGTLSTRNPAGRFVPGRKN